MKPATSSPSFSARATGCGGPVQKRCCRRFSQPGAWLLEIPPGVSIAGHVALPAPQRDLEPFADRVARALVVGVGVGERVRGQGPSADLAHDALLGLARGGVDQHVADAGTR